MSYSTYTDGWGSGNPLIVTGYAELDDLSGCIGGGYSQSTRLYSPSGRTSSSSGTTASLSYSAENGNWNVVGTYSIACNCGPQGSHQFQISGGNVLPVGSFTDNYRFHSKMSNGQKVWSRCNLGNCVTITSSWPTSGTVPAFVKWNVVRIGFVCIAVYGQPVASCSAP